MNLKYIKDVIAWHRRGDPIKDLGFFDDQAIQAMEFLLAKVEKLKAEKKARAAAVAKATNY